MRFTPIRALQIYFFLLNLVLHVEVNEAVDDSDLKTSSPHFILCRRCGRDAADPSSLVTHSLFQASPFDKHNHQKNLTSLFGRQGIPVQRLKNPQGQEFEVVLVESAKCQGLFKWTSEASWFPGFAWKSCTCTQCNQQLGWMFEPEEEITEETIKPSKNGFYALILDKIIDEAYASSLVATPKVLKN